MKGTTSGYPYYLYPWRAVMGTRITIIGAMVEVLECGHDGRVLYAPRHNVTTKMGKLRRCFRCPKTDTKKGTA